MARIKEYSGTTNTADRRFVWNGTTLAEERDSTGTTVVKRFFPGGFWQKGTNYYYLTDHLGSIKAVTITNGTVVARFEYDPYGRRTQTAGTLQVDYGFAGLLEHAGTGLKLAVWRIYDPTTGRWINRDPIREEGGWNLYAYCGGDPVNRRDCLGLRDYSASETSAFIDKAVTDLLRESTYGGRIKAMLRNHSGNGVLDTKVRNKDDRFCLNGTWIKADQFGNYLAGYAGQFFDYKLPMSSYLLSPAGVALTGPVGVKIAGSGFGLSERLGQILMPPSEYKTTQEMLQQKNKAVFEILKSIPALLDDFGSIDYIQEGQIDAMLDKATGRFK